MLVSYYSEPVVVCTVAVLRSFHILKWGCECECVCSVLQISAFWTVCMILSHLIHEDWVSIGEGGFENMAGLLQMPRLFFDLSPSLLVSEPEVRLFFSFCSLFAMKEEVLWLLCSWDLDNG